VKFCELFPCGEADFETALGVCIGIEAWKEIVDDGVGTIDASCGLFLRSGPWIIILGFLGVAPRSQFYIIHLFKDAGNTRNFEAMNQDPANARS
jgi:hypothetical protein